MIELAITKNEVEAKNEAAALATKFLRNHFGAIKGLVTKNLTVVHSWSTGASKKYANPRSAFTLIVPCSGHSISMYSLKQLLVGIRSIDKEPFYPEVVYAPSGLYISLGFHADLRLMQHITEI